MLEVNDLTLSYAVNPVVRRATFTVSEKQLFVLLGANGSGKTTILRAISGLMSPVSGDILFEGRSLAGLSPMKIVDLGIAHVPEGRHVFPEMTVRDNLLLGATRTRRNRARVKELLDESFEIFPILKDRMDQASGTMSGGEQQQLAIARGFVADPKLLILDEPSLGLAPAAVEAILRVIPRLLEFGVSVLMAEQNVDFALRSADAGVVLSSGEVRLAGNIETLRSTQEIRRAYLGA